MPVDYERGGTQKSTYSADEVLEVPCPFCGSSKNRSLASEFGAIGVKRCSECELIYTSPRIREPEAVY
jgi:hypothetical protein